MNPSHRLLMCAPEFYDVNYVINPWMEGNLHHTSKQRAALQWATLADILSRHARIERLTPELGWPDLVFTANAALVLGKTAVVSRFLYKERQGEEPLFKSWFDRNGFETRELPKEVSFEGAGDALLDRQHGWLWAGHGFRSSLQSHEYLKKWLDVEVVSLRLTDPRFYHLDTCFCPLDGGYLLYHPKAFDAASLREIENRVPAAKRLAVSEAEAATFACNAVNLDRVVVMNHVSPEMAGRLRGLGFDVIQTPLDEFILAGGAAKCLTLRLDEPHARKIARAS